MHCSRIYSEISGELQGIYGSCSKITKVPDGHVGDRGSHIYQAAIADQFYQFLLAKLR